VAYTKLKNLMISKTGSRSVMAIFLSSPLIT